MRADGGVDAAAGAFLAHDDVVQRLAHAVQALEFVLGGIAAHFQDRGRRVCVVRGELRIDPVGHAEQLFRIGDVADVGRGLGGEDREAVEPHDLRALDLGVPVGALDQPHHDLAVEPRGKVIEPVERRGGALAIGLHDDAEAVPAAQRRFRQYRLDHVERDRQAVGFFRVDVEANPGGARQLAQRAQARHHVIHHQLALGVLVARMQRRELDRDARVLADILGFRGGRDGVDGARIAQVIAAGVGFGTRRFAQHVVAVGVAFLFHVGGAFHRRLDGFAQHELRAHFLHRAGDGGADHRLAQPFDGAAQVAHGPQLVLLQHLAGQQQRPGRGVDQRRGRMAHMFAPVGRRDLVLDQRVDGFGIRHAQQRFGQAHQRDAFLGRQTVFGEENLHQPRLRMTAYTLDQLFRAGAHPLALFGAQFGGIAQRLQRFGLVGVGQRVNAGAQV